MKILVINGPNINLLGIREKEVYGTETFADLNNLIRDYACAHNHDVLLFQSNHEGELLDFIQEHYNNYDAIIINPAAYTHTSIALYDCLKAITIPTVEVHISDVYNREDFRKVNYIKDACIYSVVNEGIQGYITAFKYLEAL